MNSEEFLASVYSLIVKEIQPLAALLVDAFSKYNDNDQDGDNDNEGSSFLKGIQRIMGEKNFEKMNLNTKKPLFKDHKKNILKDTIDIKILDVQLLLKLMKETTFLKLEHKRGKCIRHNGDTCCKDCDHDHEGTKCKQCDTTKADCGKICCSSCKGCLRCHRYQLKSSEENYWKNKITMDQLKQCKICWMFPLIQSLEILLKCRNLVHEPAAKIEPFFMDGNGGSIGEFRKITDLDQLCKKIYFAATVLTIVLSKSSLFDASVKEKAKQIEKRIDDLFYFNHSIKLRLVSDPVTKEAYEHFIVDLKVVKDCVQDELARLVVDRESGIFNIIIFSVISLC